MRVSKWGWVSVVILVAFGTGFAIGRSVGYGFGTAQSWLGSMAVSATIAQRAEVLYAEGDYEAARKALENYLEFLRQVEARGGGKAVDIFWLDERGLAFDRMITYGRLALVEERRENRVDGRVEEFWRRAQEAAAAAGIKDTSASNVRSTVERTQSWGGSRKPDERP
jgi:hypothetical protein